MSSRYSQSRPVQDISGHNFLWSRRVAKQTKLLVHEVNIAEARLHKKSADGRLCNENTNGIFCLRRKKQNYEFCHVHVRCSQKIGACSKKRRCRHFRTPFSSLCCAHENIQADRELKAEANPPHIVHTIHPYAFSLARHRKNIHDLDVIVQRYKLPSGQRQLISDTLEEKAVRSRHGHELTFR